MFEIYFLNEAFDKTKGAENHYAVVVDNSELIVLTFNLLTSKYQEKSEKIKLQYYPIQDWKKAGLKRRTYVDILALVQYDIAQLKKHGRHIGKLTIADIQGLVEFRKTYKKRLTKYIIENP